MTVALPTSKPEQADDGTTIHKELTTPPCGPDPDQVLHWFFWSVDFSFNPAW
jgi:hypothetical protein